MRDLFPPGDASEKAPAEVPGATHAIPHRGSVLLLAFFSNQPVQSGHTTPFQSVSPEFRTRTTVPAYYSIQHHIAIFFIALYIHNYLYDCGMEVEISMVSLLHTMDGIVHQRIKSPNPFRKTV